MAEVQKAIQEREIYLEEVKKRAEDYKAQRQTPAPSVNAVAQVSTGDFQF